MSDQRQREPMSKVDTAWLRMERPTNLMMITGVLMFAGPLDPKRIKTLLSERFLAFRRFRQRAVKSGSVRVEVKTSLSHSPSIERAVAARIFTP